MNNTSNGHFKVLRGVKNIYSAGHVLEVDGQTAVSVWGENGNCNEIVGGDGLLFSPLHQKKEPLTFFVKQICASLYMDYSHPASFRGIDTHVYAYEFKDFAQSNMTCFCRKQTECPIKGTMDLYPCIKVPIAISLPHFYKGDPSLLEMVASGLEPRRKEHEFYLNMEIVCYFDLKF